MHFRSAAHLILIAALVVAVPASGSVAVEYQWPLASVSGNLRGSGVGLAYDRYAGEVYAIFDGVVRIYNHRGMEVYAFGEDRELGRVRGIAPLESGDLLVLSEPQGWRSLTRCNYRGEVIGKLEPTGVPAELAEGFGGANHIAYASGEIFLASLGSMRVIVLDAEGAFRRVVDLAAAAGVAEEREAHGARGFAVDADGSIYFTVQTLFRAFIVPRDGKVKGFGKKGSGPGRFNIIGPVAVDGEYIYVGDLLRHVVMVFDRSAQFLYEMGDRDVGVQGLAAPVQLAAGGGRVYVSQMGNRGVQVFRVAHGAVPESQGAITQ